MRWAAAFLLGWGALTALIHIRRALHRHEAWAARHNPAPECLAYSYAGRSWPAFCTEPRGHEGTHHNRATGIQWTETSPWPPRTS
jgi:hypothetical protein